MMNLELETIEIGRVQQIHTLRSLFGHDGPSTHALAALSQLATAVRIPAGTQLMQEGSPAGVAFFVVEGQLVVNRDGKPYDTFGPRSILGVLAALAHDERGYDCVASLDTVALMLRAEDLLEVLEDHFDMMLGAIRGMARTTIELRRQIMPHAGFSNEIGKNVLYPTRSMDLVQRIAYLRRNFSFERSYIDELAEFARSATEVRFPAGTKLWSVGDAADHAVSVVAGVVSATTPEGATFRFGPGDGFGNLDTVARVPRWFDVVVVEDMVGLSLDSEVLVDVWEDRPELGFGFLRMLATSLMSLRSRVSDQAKANAAQAAAAIKLPAAPTLLIPRS